MQKGSHDTYEHYEQQQQLHIQHFPDSEVSPKWVMKILPWPPSAWRSAKHWPARASTSTSPFPLDLDSPSPWTPAGARQCPTKRPRGSQAPQPSGGMPGGERSSLPRSSRSVRPGFPSKTLQLQRKSSVINVNMWQPLKRG